VDYADIVAAAATVGGHAVRTPLVEVPKLNGEVGFRLLVKAESLQRTGSFKFRGAFNRISQLDEAERRRGVVAFSSGNHAQGVALAAALVGVPATIVMPADAPAIKIANTRSFGAEIRLYDRATESREDIAAQIAAERGAILVKPYDDPLVIAGQGTVALEAIEQAQSAGVTFDAFIAPASGGGLIAGCALACQTLSPATLIYTAEPETLDDHARSLAAGHRLANPPGATSICDALLGPIPGELTWEINGTRLAGGLVASDSEVKQAMKTAFQELKLVLEPGGAVALAVALAGRIPGENRAVCVVASGGNVDPGLFAQILTG
jgi:threonine dehydratase